MQTDAKSHNLSKVIEMLQGSTWFSKNNITWSNILFFGLDNPLNKIYVLNWSNRSANKNYYLLCHVLNQSIVKGNNSTPFNFLQKLEISDLYNILDLLPIFEAAHSLCFAGLGVTYWL